MLASKIRRKEKTMKINHEAKEIVMTKREYNLSKTFGTDECDAVIEAMNAFKGYKVVVAKRKTTKQDYKRLTKSFMIKYIKENHPEYLEEFTTLVNKIGKGSDNGIVSFFTVRKTFLYRYPQFMTESDRKKYNEENENKVVAMPAADEVAEVA